MEVILRSSIRRNAVAASSVFGSVTGARDIASPAVKCRASSLRFCIRRRKSPSVMIPTSFLESSTTAARPRPLRLIS